MAVVGTAGHVDHGKSALVERLTGIDPDRFEEEKRRGLTIDLGFAWLTLPSGREIGIVDVPGHERFIRNMLAGAGGLSACLFVVAANEGWKPQSAEHLAIVDVLGIDHGVVALTKSDTVDDATLASVRDDIVRRLEPTSLAGAPIVPCSSVTGDGIEELTRALDDVVRDSGAPEDRGRPRLWIDRVFTIKGAGTVVTGTLAGGSFSEGSEVMLSPEGAHGRIRSIQSHKKKVSTIEPANRVALNLAGLERNQTERGDAIVLPNQWRATRHADVVVRVLDAWATGGKSHELTARGSHLLYVGSAETPVRVRLLSGNSLKPDERGYARLTLRDPLPLQRGDRFVLRDAGRVLTFGGGEVLDPLPKKANVDVLRALDGASGLEALASLVSAEGTIDKDDAFFRAGIDEVAPGTRLVARTLYSQDALEEAIGALEEALADYHRDHPLEEGIPRERARNLMKLDTATFDSLVGIARLVDNGRNLRLAEHRVSLTDEQQRAREELVSRLDAAGFTPPVASELGTDPTLLRSLAESGDIVRIENFYLSRARADEARARVRDLISQNGPATVAQIRDLLGTTRKYAVPLCGWLDATGTTVRRGDVRALGPNA
jgi:selenocysteine-specific elongation factor